MDYTDIKNIKSDVKFFIIFLILNGFTGFIMLTYVFERNFFELLLDNGFSLLVLCLIELIWMGYAICKLAKKRNIKIKDYIYILFVIPLFSISFIGQLGNSEAFACLFGKIGSELYNTYIIIINVYTLYLILKKK